MIQIDMEMPKCCAECCFANADLVGGIITLSCMTPTGRRMYAPSLINRKDRPEWCPLKEQKAVVRCFDCKYFQWGDPNDETIFCELHGRCYRWDFFCADGERKETDGR